MATLFEFKKIWFWRLFACAAAILLFLAVPHSARAFGISPPQVINDRLYPGARFEQKITMSRTDIERPVSCKAEISASGFENWITIDPGTEFTIPQGQKIQVMTVKVNVPGNAKPTRKRGTIKVTAAPATQEGIINIVLGAQIDIDLTVTAEKISELKVLQVKIPDIEIGWKSMVILKSQNTGNIPAAPDKVVLSIYDYNQKKPVKTVQTKNLQKIPPFETGEILAFFKTSLPLGNYWGQASIYKAGKIIWEEKTVFSVKPKGTLPPQPKEPLFANLDKKILVGAAVLGAMVLAFLIYFLIKTIKTKKRKRRKK